MLILVILGFILIAVGGWYFLKAISYLLKIIWVKFIASERKIDGELFNVYKKDNDYKEFSKNIDNLF